MCVCVCVCVCVCEGGGGGRGNKIGVKSHRHLMERWGRLCISQNSVGGQACTLSLRSTTDYDTRNSTFNYYRNFATFPNDPVKRADK